MKKNHTTNFQDKTLIKCCYNHLIYWIYSIFFTVCTPIIIFYLLKRSLKNNNYLKHWNERFAINIKNHNNKPIIWIHTVSVGETKAAQKLIQLYNAQLPDYQILMTIMSVTGRAIAQKEYNGAIIHYLPYDNPYSMKKFYTTFRPKVGLIFETEIWPNMLKIANDLSIPVLLVNARLSYKSFINYKRFSFFSELMISKFSAILAQDDATAQNFRKLNYNGDIKLIGSTKFDLTITDLMLNQIKAMKTILTTERSIICFASSRDGEEKLFIEAIKKNNTATNNLYIIVPRHPERFSIVENIIKSSCIIYQKKSSMTSLNSDTQIVLGDTMGELLAYYAVSKITVIGGSFAELGGQNPLESIYMSVPVIFGPHMFNFITISEMLLSANVAYQVTDMSQALVVIDTVLQDKNTDAIKDLCTKFIKDHTGASQKILEYSMQYLK
jgi:3-deoxy-D-manno-octulosonic-acid transferase